MSATLAGLLAGGAGTLGLVITIAVIILQRNAARRAAGAAQADAGAQRTEVARLVGELVASEGRRIDEAGRYHDLAAELRGMEADLAACRDPAVVRARLLRLLSDPAPASPYRSPADARLSLPATPEDRRRRG